MKSKLFTCFVALLASLAAMGQTRSVSGTVVDNLGPVTGASVIEKGTRNGTITDLDGNFTIKVREGSVLEISSIGYKTVEVKVDERGHYAISLEEDKLFLDEVVVVGYGTMKKSDLSGASVSLKEADLKGSVISSLDQTLQGRAAGVQAVQT